MTRSEFIAVTALILFGAFLLGWIASWLVHRIARAGSAAPGEVDRLAERLRETTDERDAALALLQQRDVQLATAQAEHQAALAALSDCRGEVEELRDYIEQRLTRR